jgi:hypothetical protein
MTSPETNQKFHCANHRCSFHIWYKNGQKFNGCSNPDIVIDEEGHCLR